MTLAHISRLILLADTLDKSKYEIHIAHNGKYSCFIDMYGWQNHIIPGISQEKFHERIRKITPLFTSSEIREILQAEEKLLLELKPDLIVADYLQYAAALLAEKLKIPIFTVIDPHWSPFSMQEFPVPENPIVDFLGIRTVRKLLPIFKPLFLLMHKGNLDKIRKSMGLPILKEFKENYVTGTKILYAGIPSIGLTENIPENHYYIGAVCWEPPMELPERFTKLPSDKPIVYVSFGSSGDVRLLEKIIAVLKKMNLVGIITTAGRSEIQESENILIEKFLPASKIIQKASLVIGNGGSPVVYQALSRGVPILGIPSNIDQYFTMESVEKNKVGILLRSGYVSEDALESAIGRLLADKEVRDNAKNLQREISEYDAKKIFSKMVDNFLKE